MAPIVPVPRGCASVGIVIVLNRFRVPDERRETFRDQAAAAMGVLQTKAGLVSIELVQNVDEPDLWALVHVWDEVGSYRRALQGYESKATVVPMLSLSIDEPSAYLAPELVGENRPRGA